jgi:Zn-dependent protease with chaperone function/tellurite resistance protein
MTFFENQRIARRKTNLLLAIFFFTILFIIAALYLVIWTLLYSGSAEFVSLWDPGLIFLVAVPVVSLIFLGSAYKIHSLARGGRAVAEALGGRLIPSETKDPIERKILNVVEEMAIASGTPVPPVYLLSDSSINAFAAGSTPSDAVIGVTSGCVKLLSRDELQGVIAHEFSHILNGDMRLNLRLMGILHGILLLALAGYTLLRATRYSQVIGRGPRRNDPRIALLGLGVMLVALGYSGVLASKVIKSAVSRQREFLADASAVQFTRNPASISGALKKIGAYVYGSKLESPRAEEASHMFFADGLKKSWLGIFATHPPLVQRIKQIDPGFDGRFPSIDFDSLERLSEKEASADKNLRSRTPSPAGSPGSLPIPNNPADFVRAVGAPGAANLIFAQTLLASLTPSVLESLHEPFTARAVVYSLLLEKEDQDLMQRQLQGLKERADEKVYAELIKIYQTIWAIDSQYHLSLIDLAIPALKELSEEQFEKFKSSIEYLISADGRCDLFEYCLQIVLLHHLEPAFAYSKPAAAGPKKPLDLARAAVDAIASLAFLSNEDDAKALFALQKGLLEINKEIDVSANSFSRLDYSLSRLDEALKKLASAAPDSKERVIKGCLLCIAADGKIEPSEFHLLRAICECLDCPVPPFKIT